MPLRTKKEHRHHRRQKRGRKSKAQTQKDDRDHPTTVSTLSSIFTQAAFSAHHVATMVSASVAGKLPFIGKGQDTDVSVDQESRTRMVAEMSSLQHALELESNSFLPSNATDIVIPSQAEENIVEDFCVFGKDLPARESAGLHPGQCAICLAKLLDTVQLCGNEACAMRFCSTCVAGFANEVVSSALYSVPKLRCPGCSVGLPTAAWASHAPQCGETYEANARALLTVRCSSCHEVRCLLKEYDANATHITKLPATTANALCAAWPSYFNGETQPEVLLDLLGSLEDPLEFLESIADVERRVSLHLAFLRKNPKILTPCCQAPFCFRCKVATWHEGVTCEDRQAAELDIPCQFCPQCEVPTVRAEGCSHIVCACGANWTWQDRPEAAYAIGPPENLRDMLAREMLDPNWEGDGRTLLMHAISANRPRNIEILLDAGVDINMRVSGFSALLVAMGAFSGIFQEEWVERLLELKAEVNFEDPFVLLQSSASDQKAFAKLWPLSSAGINDLHNNKTLLEVALECGRCDVATDLMTNHDVVVSPSALFRYVDGYNQKLDLLATLLCKTGFCINDPFTNDQTLLQRTLEIGNRRVAHALILNHGAVASLWEVARPNFWEDGSFLPADILEALIKHGVNVWAPAPDGILDLHPYQDAPGRLLLSYVVRQMWQRQGLLYHQNAQERAGQLAKRILDFWAIEAEAFAQTEDGSAVFSEAAVLGQIAVVRRFIEAGVNLEARHRRFNERTPLLFAVAAYREGLSCNTECLRIMIEAGADLASQDSNGDTALHIAARVGWNDAVTLLLEKGADFDAINNSGTKAREVQYGGRSDIEDSEFYNAFGRNVLQHSWDDWSTPADSGW